MVAAGLFAPPAPVVLILFDLLLFSVPNVVLTSPEVGWKLIKCFLFTGTFGPPSLSSLSDDLSIL